MTAKQAGLGPAALSLTAEASTNVPVKGSACQVTLANVFQDSKVSTVVKKQIARVLETVAETEFVCRKSKAATLLAGKFLLVHEQVHYMTLSHII